MTIYYTTAWAREKIKTLEQWNTWTESLKQGDKVLVQQFLPKSNSCLDSQVECWRFWEGVYHDDRVFYNHDMHPTKKGVCVHWNDDTPWGKVFPARLVPMHSDCAPREGDRFKDCNAPVFEPFWGTERHFVLVSHQKGYHKIRHKIKTTFKYQYERDVNQGVLFTIFGDEDLEQQTQAFEGIQYLYSESCEQ